MTTQSTINQRAKVIGGAATDDWATSPEVFATLDAEFHFTLDPCSDITNHKCPKFFTKEQNGLLQKWAPETVFINPPFSLNKQFVRKAHDEARKGALVVLLIPARTNASWFHDHVWDDKLHCVRPGVELRFIRGRIPYVGTYAEGAPFPVCVVVFNRGCP